MAIITSDQRTQFSKLIQLIGQHLTGTWEYKADAEQEKYVTSYFDLEGEADERLQFSVEFTPAYKKRGGREARLKISGYYPRTRTMEYVAPRNSPEITVSADRDPAAIAKDIERRFLPQYREALQYVRQIIQKRDSYSDALESNMQLLATILGEKLTPESLRREWFIFNEGDCYAKIRPSADAVRFDEFEVPISIAIEIVKLIALKTKRK